MTLTVTVQLPEAGMDAPDKENEDALARAETVPPGHVVDPAGDAEVLTPKGKKSVIATPVRAIAFPFVSVTVRSDVAPVRIEGGVKLLAGDGGDRTFKTALAGATLDPPFVVVTPPTGIVFV